MSNKKPLPLHENGVYEDSNTNFAETYLIFAASPEKAHKRTIKSFKNYILGD